MLRLNAVVAGYGGGTVLRGVGLTVEPGRVVGLVGRNGVGKTTTIRTILGQTERIRGSIDLDGTDLTRLPPHRIPPLGIGVVPQGRRVFPGLTVRQNLTAGWSSHRLDEARWAEVMASFPRVAERLGQRAGTLSGGEQQMVAFARVLLANPKVALLDEPTEGLMPSLVAEVERHIGRMREGGAGVLLAEQRLETVLRLCDEVVVLDRGSVVWHGSAEQADPTDLARAIGARVER